MNSTVKNVLMISCAMLGAGLSMIGKIMGDNDKNNDKKIIDADQK